MKSFVLSFLLLIGITALAQTDFSGTWELNKDKSQLNEEFSMAPFKLVLTQDDNLLTLERHSEFRGETYTSESKFTLDGEESVNPGWRDVEITSIAEWNDDKDVLAISSRIPMQDGGEMKTESVYTLVDGNLKVVSKASSSYGDLEEVWVFVKK